MNIETQEQFFEVFKNDTACEKYIFNNIYNGTKPCPYCGCEKHYNLVERKTTDTMRYKCANKYCSRKWSVTSRMISSNLKLPLQKLFYLIWIYTTKDTNTCAAAVETGMIQKTTWSRKDWLQKVLTKMDKNTPKEDVFKTALHLSFTERDNKPIRDRRISKNNIYGQLQALQ